MASNNKSFTVKEMREVAKQSKVSEPREAAMMVTTNLLDSPLPDLDAPILQPIKQKPKSFAHRIRDKFSKYQYDITRNVNVCLHRVKSTASIFADWIINFVPEAPKKTEDEKIEALKSTLDSIYRAQNKVRVKESKTAIKGFAKQYIIDGVEGADAWPFLNAMARKQAVKLLNENRMIKVNLVLYCEMERIDMKSGEVTNTVAPFVSKTEAVLESTDVNELYDHAIDKIMKALDAFQMRSNNWRFKLVQKLEINSVVYKPLRGKSYVPLPDELAKKNAVINVKNKDDQCFKWCITRALNPTDIHAERITKELRNQAEELDWSDIEFPDAMDEIVIKKFENNNDVSINVFGYTEVGGVFSLYVSKHQSERMIDLLLITDSKTKHYCWKKNLNRLMTKKTEKSTHSMHYCRRCLTGYRTVDALTKHDK